MSTPLIRLRDVDFSHGPDRPVLSQCSFGLRAGERVALLGANGSGKTSLLHLIVGLVHAQGGTIEVFGAERKAETDFHEVRRRVGLLFQDADDQLFCPTVAEDVAFGPMNLGQSRDEAHVTVAETLAELGLVGYEHRITWKLSGGEKRLVALATVLAMRPDVLLRDEPAAGLDDQATDRLVGILNDLPQATIVVSHQREFLDRVTTSKVRLVGGRIEDA